MRLAPAERLLDVGCGLGDAARALAADLGPAGEVVGIDASTVMLDAARAGWDVLCPARFRVGDAQALDVPSGSFDAARSVRVLQWLPDPQSAVTELARVLRAGARASSTPAISSGSSPPPTTRRAPAASPCRSRCTPSSAHANRCRALGREALRRAPSSCTHSILGGMTQRREVLATSHPAVATFS